MVLVILSQDNPLEEGDMSKNNKTPLLIMRGGVFVVLLSFFDQSNLLRGWHSTLNQLFLDGNMGTLDRKAKAGDAHVAPQL